MTDRKGFLKGIFVLSIFSFLLLIVSCSSVPNKFTQSNIGVVTNNKVVAGMHFVNGWATEADTQYTAQSVGNMVANDMGKKGSHDITVLVELKSRGTHQEMNMWTISVYDSQSPDS